MIMKMRDIINTVNEGLGSRLMEASREGFKAWFNAIDNENVILSGKQTHLNVLMRSPKQYSHQERWDVVKALKQARDAGWVRLAVEVAGEKTVAVAQCNTLDQAVKALRWMRKHDSNVWDVLRVHTFEPDNYFEIEDEGKIEHYLKTGRLPQ